MCTLTWRRHAGELQVWFNRDEQTIRPDALPPKCYHWENVQVVAPIDPPSKGTWIATNEFGLTVALLNWYLTPAKAGKVSRGQLVKALAQRQSLAEVMTYITDHDFSIYAPFHCVLYDRTHQRLLTWDGEQLQQADVPEILTSSSVDTTETIQRRIKKFNDFRHLCATCEDYFSFHQQHDADFPPQSVCVHREFSRTMSHTHIRVTTTQTTMRYFDGYPCQVTPSTSAHEVSLRLQETF